MTQTEADVRLASGWATCGTQKTCLWMQVVPGSWSLMHLPVWTVTISTSITMRAHGRGSLGAINMCDKGGFSHKGACWEGEDTGVDESWHVLYLRLLQERKSLLSLREKSSPQGFTVSRWVPGMLIWGLSLVLGLVWGWDPRDFTRPT